MIHSNSTSSSIQAIASLVGACLLITLLAGCPQQEKRTVMVQGQERSYEVFIPSTYNPETPTPLLLAFHGAFRTNRMFRDDVRLDIPAEREGFIVAYPQAKGTVWHSVENIPGDVNDVRFIEEVLDQLQLDFNIDDQRIYATGLSLGGVFTYSLLCELPHRIAGIATVAAGGIPLDLQASCASVRPVPFMAIHGTEDPSLTFEGREESQYFPAQFALVSVPETFAQFAEKFDCTISPQVASLVDADPDDGTQTAITEVLDCEGRVVASLYVIEGGGHTWPGSQQDLPLILGRNSKDFNASDLIIEFFAQFGPEPSR